MGKEHLRPLGIRRSLWNYDAVGIEYRVMKMVGERLAILCCVEYPTVPSEFEVDLARREQLDRLGPLIPPNDFVSYLGERVNRLRNVEWIELVARNSAAHG